MNQALLALYRHKTWATLRLIEYCQPLDDVVPEGRLAARVRGDGPMVCGASHNGAVSIR